MQLSRSSKIFQPRALEREAGAYPPDSQGSGHPTLPLSDRAVSLHCHNSIHAYIGGSGQ